MRHAQFLVLTGRLDEFPLYDLLETLRAQRKTGRLLVEFSAGPATFHFSKGALVDAHLGELRGPEALTLALSLEDAAAFNFNPLVTPPRADNRDDAVPFPPRRDSVIEVATSESAVPPATPLPRADVYALPPAPGGGEMMERLSQIEKAVAAQSRRANIERAVYAAVTVTLILVAFNWRGRDPGGRVEAVALVPHAAEAQVAAASAEPPPRASANQTPLSESAPEPAAGEVKRPGRANATRSPAVAPAATQPATPAQPGGQAVQVRLTVEQGRVVRAEVSNPRPGMSAYEALALRIARQRRFPTDFSGQETLRLKVGR